MNQLHESWVDEIFNRLTVRYGRSFTSRWDGIDIALVKADWARELAGFAMWPEAISWAFDHLDATHAPTVTVFRDTAFKAPKPQRQALPEPVADKARVEAALKGLAPAPDYNRYNDWIRAGLERIRAGEKMTPAVAGIILDAAKAKGMM